MLDFFSGDASPVDHSFALADLIEVKSQLHQEALSTAKRENGSGLLPANSLDFVL